MLRIGLLTSGGDCQALNATMRGIVKTIIRQSNGPVEIYGFLDGYQGLIYNKRDRRSAKGLETEEPDFRQSRYHHADNLPQYPSPSRLRTIPLVEHVKINCDLFRLLAQKCGPLYATLLNSFQLLRVDAVAANIQRRHPTHGLQLLGEHTRLEARVALGDSVHQFFVSELPSPAYRIDIEVIARLTARIQRGNLAADRVLHTQHRPNSENHRGALAPVNSVADRKSVV